MTGHHGTVCKNPDCGYCDVDESVFKNTDPMEKRNNQDLQES